MKATQWMWGFWMRATLATLLGTAVGCVDASDGDPTGDAPEAAHDRGAVARPGAGHPLLHPRAEPGRFAPGHRPRQEPVIERRAPDRGAGDNAAGGLVHGRDAGRGQERRSQDDARREGAASRPGPGRVQHPVPRLRAVLGGRRHRHGRVQGLDRRLRGGHRRRSGRRDPRARLAGHHPLQHDDLRRRRLVQADGHRRGAATRSPRPAPAPTSATRSSTTRSTRSRPRPRARCSTSTGPTAPGWASERRRIGS